MRTVLTLAIVIALSNSFVIFAEESYQQTLNNIDQQDLTDQSINHSNVKNGNSIRVIRDAFGDYGIGFPHASLPSK